MAEPYKHIFKVDLSEPLKRFDVGNILASGDEKANRFEITVCRGGENVDLSGAAAYGYFIRPNDETFKVNGTVKDNVVKLEPSKSCYVYDGAFSLAVKLSSNDSTQTISVFDGRIVKTTSENIVDGDRVFYSLEDMLAQIAVMEAASKNAVTATNNANIATERANYAASAIENITASATNLISGMDAVVDVVDENGVKHFRFGIPRGDKGDKGDPGTIENVTITSIDGLPEALAEKLPSGGHTPNMFLGTDADGAVVEMDAPTFEIPDFYRVGDIYITTNSTSPAELFGGEWEQIKDRFLLAAGSTYMAGSMGGEAEHTLTVDEMPSHRHKMLLTGTSTSAADASDRPGKDKSYSSQTIMAGGDTIELTGGGQAHNNMPPYLAVYIWRRVA